MTEINSDELIEALKPALEEKVKLEQKRLEEVQFVAQALRRLDTIAKQLEMATQKYMAIDDVIRDLTKDLPEQMDRLERAILALLSGQTPGKGGTKELQSEIIRDHIDSLKRRLKIQHDNLNKYSEDAAQYGPFPPLEIRNSIDSVEQKIADIQAEINHYQNI